MLLVLALTMSAVTAQNDQWKSYSYTTDGFSLAAPSAPVLSKQNIPTQAGTVELRGYLVDMGGTAFYVGVVDYGKAASGRDPGVILQGAKQGAINNLKAHLVKESNVTLGIYPGVDYEAENGSLHFNMRIYMVGSVLYQVMAASPIREPFTGTDRFLDSFQLIPRTR